MGDGGKAGFGNNPHAIPQPGNRGKPGFGNNPHAIHPSPASTQRNAGKVQSIGGKAGEILSKRLLEWANEADAKLKWKSDVLIPFIHVRGMQFLDQWLIQMVSAKSDAVAPPEESKDYWYVALIGNLLWAASCFVPGAGVVSKVASTLGGGQFARISSGAGMTNLGKVMYVTMSQVGAVVGSAGPVLLATDSGGNPSGKDVVSDVLNDKRTKLGEALRKNEERWASELMHREGFGFDSFYSNTAKYLQEVDQVLWANIFPTISFEDYKGIYRSGLNAINGALSDFNRQYQAWTQAVRNWAEYDSRGRYGIHAETFYERLDYYKRHRSFKPQLNFHFNDG